MKRFHKICSVLFVVLLWLPMIQRMTNLVSIRPLNGVISRTPEPRLSAASWFDGSYQRVAERYFNERFGFRACFVRTYNQIVFSAFGLVPGRRGTQLEIGKENWLYEREYIRHYVRPGGATRAHLEPLVLAVRRLQDALQARGKAFVLLISPSKAEIYPEYIPEVHRATRNDAEQVTNYDRLVPLLAEHGIRCVDAHALFLRLKKTSPYPLFAKSGTHWNHYAIVHVLQAVARLVGEQRGRPLPVPAIDAVRMLPPDGADKDLSDLLNLWNASSLEAPTPYVEMDPAFRPYAERPSVLIVGDSFAFTIVDALRQARLAAKTDIVYYFKRHFDYPLGDSPLDHATIAGTPLDRDRVDWNRLLFEKDIVILEVNEIFVKHLGWGFPEAAARALEDGDDGGDK